MQPFLIFAGVIIVTKQIKYKKAIVVYDNFAND